MGTVSSVTSQLKTIRACSNNNCCDQIDAIKGELVRQSQRISTLEGEIGIGRSALRKAEAALSAINPLEQKAAQALDIGNQNSLELDLLAAAIAAAAALAAKALELGGSAINGVANLGIQVGNSLAGGGAVDREARAAAANAQRTADAAGAAAANAQRTADAAAATAADANRNAESARSTAIYAARNAESALGVASDADRKAESAAGAAANAQRTAEAAASAASAADRKAESASAAANAAQRAADAANGKSEAANRKADAAARDAAAANKNAAAANSKAAAAQRSADSAAATAKAATSAAAAANSKAAAATNAAAAANSKAAAAASAAAAADRNAAAAAASAAKSAASAASAANATNTQNSATTAPTSTNSVDRATATAQRALITAQRAAITAQQAAITANAAGTRTATITTTISNPVTEADKAAITTSILQGVRTEVAALPAVLVASQAFKAAAISAAQVGSCQSSKAGNCPGGTKDQIDNLGDKILNAVGAAASTVNNQLLQGIAATTNAINATVNILNTKLGAQITGGLSAWAAATAEVVNKSQVLNALTYITTLHNAYMLSNALTQTLFSAISNGLAALGLKDTSTDPAGTPFNVGQIVEQFVESFFKTIFGVATVDGIKADWKKYSRVYQAAAQMVYSLQSISSSILGALEVVNSNTSKIGNALQKFRAVGERAYAWMNPQASFQNRFTNAAQQATEIISSIDQVSSSILSTQQTLSELSKQKDELAKSIGEDPAGKKVDPQPEAAQIKAAAEAAKIASKTPEIPESAQTKP